VAAGEISRHDEITYGMPVDGRSQLEPPQSSDFLGNNAIGYKTADTVERLTAPHSLGAAAFAIRTAVESVDGSYIKNLITVLDQVPNYGQVFLDMLGNLKTTGLFLTSLVKLSYADLDSG